MSTPSPSTQTYKGFYITKGGICTSNADAADPSRQPFNYATLQRDIFAYRKSAFTGNGAEKPKQEVAKTTKETTPVKNLVSASSTKTQITSNKYSEDNIEALKDLVVKKRKPGEYGVMPPSFDIKLFAAKHQSNPKNTYCGFKPGFLIGQRF